ncbi:phage holin family protein [bacterium]|nr:phage holin family protein [bacterium]
MRKLIFQIFAGILGLYLAARFIPGVEFYGPRKIFLLAGTILGLFNYFIKPLLELILFPLRLLTLGLISLIINVGVVWFVIEVVFGKYFVIPNFFSFLLLVIIIYLVSFALTSIEPPLRRHH